MYFNATLLTDFKKDRLILFISVLLSVMPLFGQNNFTSRWSKTAGSLTIFQPGDAVRIEVWELYDNQEDRLKLSRDYAINPNGNIVMPLLGEIRVKGLTVIELNTYLEKELKTYLKSPLVYVYPLIRITLIGAFNSPGSYLIPPSASLWEAIALAGGPSGDSNISRLSIQRGGEIVMEDVLTGYEKGYSLEEIGIQSGDQIICPAKARWGLVTFLAAVNIILSIMVLYMRLREEW